MKKSLVLILAAITVAAALLFSLFFPFERIPELPMPKSEVIRPESWARAVDSSAEVRKEVGNEYEIVGSGYIKDTGLLMLRSGNRYYLVQIKENEVIEVKEQKIGWKTWEDTIRDYPGLENAVVVMRSALSSHGDSFYSLVALTPEKNYFVAMDENYSITDVDPIEPNAWLDMVKDNEEAREKIGGGRWRLKSYDVLPLNGQNSISLCIEAGGKQHLVSIEPEGYVKYLQEFKVTENKSSSQNQDPLEVAKKDERIRELIDGKEYAFSTPVYISGVSSFAVCGFDNNTSPVETKRSYVGNYTLLTLNVEGKYYSIRISDEELISVTPLEERWLTTALADKKLETLKDDCKLLGSCLADIDAEPIAILFIESERNIYTVFLNIGMPAVRYVEKVR